VKKSLFLLIAFAFSFPFPLFASDPNIERLSHQSLSENHHPEVSVETLPNGMKLYLLEDHELPVFQMFAYIRGGSIQDPPDKAGLASLLGTVLRTGGTQKQTVESIDRYLENHGAQLETGMSQEYGTAYLQALSQDIKEMIPLFFDVLATPRLEPGQIDLARQRKIEALKRVNEDPEKIAFREFPKLLYGPSSVWARSSSEKTLNAVNREDLLRYHYQFYHPDRLILAVSGDFKKEELIRWIELATQNWPKASAALPEIPAVKKEDKAGISVIEHKGDQSTLLVGHFGDKRSNPDKFALILMNYILGGDIFSSRLGEEIRSNRGLAYSIFSHFGLETDYGLFYAMAQTRSEATAEVVSLIQKEIRDAYEGKGFTQSSLDFAKESILNQMMGDWEPRFNYVKERARLGFFGYPENYLEFYKDNLKAVTLDQVRMVARKYLFPDRLQVLVVGNGEVVEPSLKKIGDVKRVALESF
jgi:predicted Zn-dependent peptidase